MSGDPASYTTPYTIRRSIFDLSPNTLVELALVRAKYHQLFLKINMFVGEELSFVEEICLDKNPELFDIYDFHKQNWDPVETERFIDGLPDVSLDDQHPTASIYG